MCVKIYALMKPLSCVQESEKKNLSPNQRAREHHVCKFLCTLVLATHKKSVWGDDGTCRCAPSLLANACDESM